MKLTGVMMEQENWRASDYQDASHCELAMTMTQRVSGKSQSLSSRKRLDAGSVEYFQVDFMNRFFALSHI